MQIEIKKIVIIFLLLNLSVIFSLSNTQAGEKDRMMILDLITQVY